MRFTTCTGWASIRAINAPASDQINKAILQKELDLIAPRDDSRVVVVALGREASLALNTPFPGIRSKAKIEKRDGRLVLPVMHISGIAQRWRAVYLKAHGVNPTSGSVGIAKIIVKAIKRFRAQGEREQPGVRTTIRQWAPSPARPADSEAPSL